MAVRLHVIFTGLVLVNQNSHTLTAAPVKGSTKHERFAVSNISDTWQNYSLEQLPDADVSIPILYSGTYANIVDLPFNWFVISIFLTLSFIVCVCGVWHILKRDIATSQKQQLSECTQNHGEVGKVPKGIPNIGNTCYMNSLLQVLSWTPQIRQEIDFHLKTCVEERSEPVSHGIPRALWEFIESYHANPRKLDARPILQEARKINSQFIGHDQQDSFELFNTIIEGVEVEQEIEADFQRFTSISVPMPKTSLQSKKETHIHNKDLKCNENAYNEENKERLQGNGQPHADETAQHPSHSKFKDSVTVHATTFNCENEQERRNLQEINDHTGNSLTNYRQETDMEISDDESSANIPVNNMVRDLGSEMQGQVDNVAKEVNITPFSEGATILKRQEAHLEESETSGRVYSNKQFEDNEIRKEEIADGQQADSTNTTRLDIDNSSLSERSNKFPLSTTPKTEFLDINTQGILDASNISHNVGQQCFETLQAQTVYGTDVERGLLELTDLEQLNGTVICCRECNSGGEGNTHKKLLVISAPPVLVLQINKFNQENRRLYKINQAMTYPLRLNLSAICSSAMQVLDKTVTSANGIEYFLYGVVAHIGSLEGGHYTAYIRTNQNQGQLHHTFPSREWKDPMKYEKLIIKHLTEDIRDRDDRRDPHQSPDAHIVNQTDLWFCVSDMVVRECEVSEAIQNKDAYMLFYEHIN